VDQISYCSKGRSTNWFLLLALLFFFALTLRFIVHLSLPNGLLAADEGGYYEDAMSLLESGDLPTFWPPFTILTIAFFSIIGNTQDIITIRLLWIFLDAFNTVGAALICSWLSRERVVGMVAGILYALYLPAIVFSQFLTSETLAVFIAVCMLGLLLSPSGGIKVINYAACGILAGCLVLTRTNLLFVAFLPLVFVFLFRSRRLGEVLIPCLAFVITSTSVVCSFALWNKAAHGEFFISRNSSYNFYLGNKQHYSEDLNIFNPVATELQKRDRIIGSEQVTILADNEMRELAWGYISAQPGEFLRRAIGRLSRVLVPKTDHLQVLGRKFTISYSSAVLFLVGLLQYGASLFLAIPVIVNSLLVGGLRKNILVAYILCCLPLCMLAISKPRYSFPFDFTLIILSVLFIFNWRGEVATLKDRNGWRWVLALYFFVAWSWVAWFVFVYTSRFD